jgi:hypothetical protein
VDALIIASPTAIQTPGPDLLAVMFDPPWKAALLAGRGLKTVALTTADGPHF